MISIVVPVWRRDVYQRVTLPWIEREVSQGAELIEVSGGSIFEAYESGRQRASNDVIVYVHDDARLISPHTIAHKAPEVFKDYPDLGLIGPYGRGTEPKVLPWWMNDGPWAGHYMQYRRGQPVYRYANNNQLCMSRGDGRRWHEWQSAAFVDGFCLIEHRQRMDVPWDTETFKGQWHGYDVDRCMQAHERGLKVMVSPFLWMHENGGHAGYKGTDPERKPRTDHAGRKAETDGDALWLQDLDEVNGILCEKWNLDAVTAGG